ncbi:interleukin-12 subunit beta isoform X1 [Xenopus laevis]|uniref:Interleukin-12 subunit beta n=3 Tax=Xenopus laevis TaxID=8355 RepID=A0A1L8GR16_XENLA|nr:interleukin-12 subunit beta isoform X1 [Xenopus laevis]OCT86272.1 hypothetical protein XELAEV_18019964mg [Xenopus laevis]
MAYLKPAVLLLMLCVNTIQGFWDLSILKNTYIVDITEKAEGEVVSFECPVAEKTKVYWLLKGYKRPGRILKTHVMENEDAGNFTCHHLNGELVDYKTVLLKHWNRKHLPEEQPIYCEAKNYSGHFKCFWSRERDEAQYIFEAHRGNHIISCEKPIKNNSKYEVNCHDNEFCQYGEENDNITIHLHVFVGKQYENHSLSFMLRYITKPDPPAELSKSGDSLKWKYPKTWCSEHSFFPLIFNLNITKQNESPRHYTDIDITEKNLKPPLPFKGKFIFCVQARDMFHNSAWSDWSCSKHSKPRKKQANKPKKKKKPAHR